MRFKVHARLRGGHVECRVFVQPELYGTWANCGTLVVRKGEEFASLVRAMSGAEIVAEGDQKTVELAPRDGGAA